MIPYESRFTLLFYVFVGTCFAGTMYIQYCWGADMPLALFGHVFLITTSSVLVSTRFGLTMACIAAVVTVLLGYMQSVAIFAVSMSWRSHMPDTFDTLEYTAVILIIVLVALLSNIEIGRLLQRARRSEAALAQERARELYRFAEMGRLAAGWFHDLMNPLTALTVSLSALGCRTDDVRGDIEQLVGQSMAAAHRMEQFLDALRKQMCQQRTRARFRTDEAVREAFRLLAYKARRTNVRLALRSPSPVVIESDPARFHQMVVNLISNAIDSYEGVSVREEDRQVEVAIESSGNNCLIRVRDEGCGIPVEHLARIFEPFFTTKVPSRGTGIGLATVKAVVEQELRGNIKVQSAVGQGTLFRIEFPLNTANATVN